MAIVIAPALSQRASGNVGSTNFTRWRGRNVARAAWSPTIPNTGPQVNIQDMLTAAVGHWLTGLTQAMREAWCEYARGQVVIDRLGGKRVPTGYNLYIGRQIQASRTGAPFLSWPPTMIIDAGAVTIETDFVVIGTIGKWRIDGWTSTDRPDFREYWMAGEYDSGARAPTSDEWRFNEYQADNTWATFNGTPNRWIWVRARMAYSDGRVGNWLQSQLELAP